VRRAAGHFLGRLNGDADISIVCPILGVVYAATLGGLVAVGFTPAIPWTFLPYLALVVVPCATVVRMPYLVAASRFLGNIDARRVDQRGEPVSRYRTQFDLIERLKGLQLQS
jgi:hypothetical protein